VGLFTGQRVCDECAPGMCTGWPGNGSPSRLKKLDTEELADLFVRQFQTDAQLFRAPGRVNLIGEHTDYNHGFVLPSAIGFYNHVAISPRADRKLVLRSTEFSDAFEFDAFNLPQEKQGKWCDYVLGVAHQLARTGIVISGANFLVHGEVPVGSGLSSSAALEVASALAFLSLDEKTLSLKQIAMLCQSAENEFVGARVGIMDQFVSCFGESGRAVLIDCRSLDFELVQIPAEVSFVICNTMVKHENSGGEYNRRREQCELGVRLLTKFYPGITALRDVSFEQLSAHESDLPPVVYRRCLHVVRENERTLQAARLFQSGDLASVGRLMRESHESLRDLYEVSCSELDAMVESAEGLPGFVGGRMTGGGFGGCTINLVERSKAQSFAQAVGARYQQRTGVTPDVFICSAADGAGAETRKATV
jgi:galactokinase